MKESKYEMKVPSDIGLFEFLDTSFDGYGFSDLDQIVDKEHIPIDFIDEEEKENGNSK